MENFKKGKCVGFGHGYIKDADDCLWCKKNDVEMFHKCKKENKQNLKYSCSTDEEIQQWLAENKNTPKRIAKK